LSLIAEGVAADEGKSALKSDCPVCGTSSGQLFFEAPAVPVHCNILWPTEAAARLAPRAELRLALCRGCGLVYNVAFDPGVVTYDASYENSLHHSPRFEEYAGELARELTARFQLAGKLVVEVGCGKGEFLKTLCRTAGSRGIGIDASYDPSIDQSGDESVAFFREPFTTLPSHFAPSLVLCRHVIEHLPSPAPFVAELAAAARRSSGCTVFVEVPNVLYTLRDLGIWDLIYEHCSYFSGPALAHLCFKAGLRAENVYPAFGGQFLCAEASPTWRLDPPQFREELNELDQLVSRFAAEYALKVEYWRRRLAELRASGDRFVVWGAGSKGITFVNTVPGGEAAACLVDLNPRKHGRFVPGTGQQVVGPPALKEVRPSVIVVMNPLYREEIEGRCRELGVDCRVEVG
jgi:Methyltransferase domain/C-methyltransferase C-terminal domain